MRVEVVGLEGRVGRWVRVELLGEASDDSIVVVVEVAIGFSNARDGRG